MYYKFHCAIKTKKIEIIKWIMVLINKINSRLWLVIRAPISYVIGTQSRGCQITTIQLPSFYNWIAVIGRPYVTRAQVHLNCFLQIYFLISNFIDTINKKLIFVELRGVQFESNSARHFKSSSSYALGRFARLLPELYSTQSNLLLVHIYYGILREGLLGLFFRGFMNCFNPDELG